MNADELAHGIAEVLSENPALEWLACATPTNPTERELFKSSEDWFHIVLGTILSDTSNGFPEHMPRRSPPAGWSHVSDEVEMAVTHNEWPTETALATTHRAWLARHGVTPPVAKREAWDEVKRHTAEHRWTPFKATSCDMLLELSGERVWLELKQMQHRHLKNASTLGLIDDVRKLDRMHLAATQARWDDQLLSKQATLGPKRDADRHKAGRIRKSLADASASWCAAAVAICWVSGEDDTNRLHARVQGALTDAKRTGERPVDQSWSMSTVHLVRSTVVGVRSRFAVIACVRDIGRPSV